MLRYAIDEFDQTTRDKWGLDLTDEKEFSAKDPAISVARFWQSTVKHVMHRHQACKKQSDELRDKYNTLVGQYNIKGRQACEIQTELEQLK